jgi:hypothetical protein
MTAVINRVEGRQWTVFRLCHYGDCTPREVAGLGNPDVRSSTSVRFGPQRVEEHPAVRRRQLHCNQARCFWYEMAAGPDGLS